MTTLTKTRVIDADAHVVETAHTWDYMDPSEMKYRPTLVQVPGEVKQQLWLIDGNFRGATFPAFTPEQLARMSTLRGRRFETDRDASEMTNVDLRLKHMDESGADVQVLHTTLFLAPVSDKVAVEVALCKSYNRWLADVWKQGGGRLRWSTVLPLLSIPDAIDLMRFAKENGAVAVLIRPIEASRLIFDPYFYPIYEEASRLDMAIAVHIGNGSMVLRELSRHPQIEAQAFHTGRIPTVAAVHDLVMSEVPKAFPKLRFAFIEASAAWMPWIWDELKKRFSGIGRDWPEDLAKEYNIWVTCENTDDLPYIISRCGDDSLLIGTDYGHTDPSSDLDAIKVFASRSDISDETKRKVMTDNPIELYAL